MLIKLQGYNFSISHRPGAQNQLADGLSRLPTPHNNAAIDLDDNLIVVLRLLLFQLRILLDKLVCVLFFRFYKKGDVVAYCRLATRIRRRMRMGVSRSIYYDTPEFELINSYCSINTMCPYTTLPIITTGHT